MTQELDQFLTFQFAGDGGGCLAGDLPVPDDVVPDLPEVDIPAAPELPDTSALKLIKADGNESVSDCFDFTLRFVSTTGVEIDGSQLVGTFGTLAFARRPDLVGPLHSRRRIRGVIRRFASLPDEAAGFPTYELNLMPWFWLLKHRMNCRVFQSKTALEIVEEILCEWQSANAEEVAFDLSKLEANYSTLHYCVQYRESDFDFISRVLEREGIFYYFDWINDKTTLVLADSNNGFNPTNETFEDNDAAGRFTDVVVSDAGLGNWRVEHNLVEGNPKVGEFNFHFPSNVNEWQAASNTDWAPESRDHSPGFVHRWPEGFPPADENDNIAGRGRGLHAIAQAARDVARSRIEVDSSYAHIQAGRDLVDAMQLVPGAENYFSPGQHLVLSATHRASQPHVTSEVTIGTLDYASSLICLPDTQPFRPLQETRKPTIEGPQTAIVVGAAGKTSSLNGGECDLDVEAATDSLGRVKVRFHWDGSSDCEDTSCWVRVSQAWAGQGYGSFSLPHVGQEVIVSFLEGDPDRPLISGRVYNGENRVSQITRTADEGNELVAETFADDGSRSSVTILGRDQVGNEVHMDSTEGEEHILLSSPGQGSYFRVGNTDGIIVRTEGGLTELFDGWDIRYTYANSWYLTVGVAANAQIGGTLDLLVGSAFECALASKLGVTVGFEADFTLAGKAEFSAGAVYSVSKEASLHESGDDVETRSDGDITLDAQGDLILVGGADTGNGRLAATSTGVCITVGSGNVADAAGAGWKSGLAGFVAAAAAIASAVAVPVSTATAVTSNPPSDKELLDGKDNTALLTEGGIALGSSIAAAIALKVAAKLAKTRLRTSAHTTVSSGVNLTTTQAALHFGPSANSNGIFVSSAGVLISNAAKIDISAGTTVGVTGTTVTVTASTAFNANQALSVLP